MLTNNNVMMTMMMMVVVVVINCALSAVMKLQLLTHSLNLTGLQSYHIFLIIIKLFLFICIFCLLSFNHK